MRDILLSMARQQLTTDDLLFVSFGKRLFALDREDGSIVWKWEVPKGGSTMLAILPSVDRVFASSQGYTWALDAVDGKELWFQPFKGEGVGIPMLATMSSGSASLSAAAAAAAAAQAANS